MRACEGCAEASVEGFGGCEAATLGCSRRFADGELNIAESGNGIPDLLDEAKWELDFIAAMVSENGCAFNKVSHHGWAPWGTGPPIWKPQCTLRHTGHADHV